MVGTIKRDKRLIPYLKTVIEDAGISVDIDDKFCDDDYAAIKVDGYYAGQRMAAPPKSVDFVVVVDCQCASFVMYILEFKNVDGPSGLDIAAIQEKFSNTINLFLSDTFSDIFLNDRYKYKDIKLFLISDAYNEVGKFKNHEEFLKFRSRINAKDTLKVDLALSSKLYKFRGRLLRISYDIPPNPVITHT